MGGGGGAGARPCLPSGEGGSYLLVSTLPGGVGELAVRRALGELDPGARTWVQACTPGK